ncbi:MAG: hypothetical protein ACRDKW_15485 [Actinomycetota bacterium]
MPANRHAAKEVALARALDAQVRGDPEAALATLDGHPDRDELVELVLVVDRMREALHVSVPPATRARHELLIMAELLRPVASGADRG